MDGLRNKSKVDICTTSLCGSHFKNVVSGYYYDDNRVTTNHVTPTYGQIPVPPDFGWEHKET